MSGAEIGTIIASLAALTTAIITYRKTASEAKKTHSDIGMTNVTAAGDVVSLLRSELERVNAELADQRDLGSDLKGTIGFHEASIRRLEARIRRLEAFLVAQGYDPNEINGVPI